MRQRTPLVRRMGLAQAAAEPMADIRGNEGQGQALVLLLGNSGPNPTGNGGAGGNGGKASGGGGGRAAGR
jgi:hypothetical protein